MHRQKTAAAPAEFRHGLQTATDDLRRCRIPADEVNVRSDFSNIVAENQRHLEAELTNSFDYVVWGAGTSGSACLPRGMVALLQVLGRS